jgi:hypothetical protein
MSYGKIVQVRNLANVNPYVPGRTVCRDTFSFGGSGSSRYAWKLKVLACINYVTLSLRPNQTPVTLPATLTVLSLVLSMPFINSPLIPPVYSRHCASVIISVGWKETQDSKEQDRILKG